MTDNLVKRAREAMVDGDHDPITWYDESDGFQQATKVPPKWVLVAHSEIIRLRRLMPDMAARIEELEARIAELEVTLGYYRGVMPYAFVPINDGGKKARAVLKGESE